MSKSLKLLTRELNNLVSDLEDAKKIIPDLFSTSTYLKLQAAGLLGSVSKKAKKKAEDPIAVLLKKITADKDLSKATVIYLKSTVDRASGFAKDTLKLLEVLYPLLDPPEQEAILLAGYSVLQQGLVLKEWISNFK